MTETDKSPHQSDLRFAAIGGIATATIGFVGIALVGTVNSVEARQQLDSVLPTVRFAASAYIAGGASVLALMLTLLTFTISHDIEYRSEHYRRIRHIAAMNTAVIATSVVVLMFLGFPFGESNSTHWWHIWVYYAILLGGAITGGIFISIVMMLYYAVRELVKVGLDPARSQLVAAEKPPSR